MFNIKSINKYLDCPMKVYIEVHVLNEKSNINQSSFDMNAIKIDIEKILKKNIKYLKKDMTLNEIEVILSRDIENYLNNIFSSSNIKNASLKKSAFSEIQNYIFYRIKNLSLKSNQIMNALKLNGMEIGDIIFPYCIYDYIFKDEKIGLTGVCEKTEIIDDNYYPILLRDSNPPINGVWINDALELAAQALLLEEVFDCSIFVGFVDYDKISERRSVIMDAKLKRKLFSIIHKINNIIDNKELPLFERSNIECEKCEYKEICIKQES